MLGDEGGEYEPIYFRRLDDELNKVKVNHFYKSKVEEPADMNQLASDVATSAAFVTASTPSGDRRATG
uniref:Uncharacterized protein n=1 Tax=Nelumbo nucifera TaxID=4432 RepID=A0A822XMH0_NELNU|nr:TPA_asm: hypothetical protein HUJ06_021609 [Nelumbo nucifera]